MKCKLFTMAITALAIMMSPYAKAGLIDLGTHVYDVDNDRDWLYLEAQGDFSPPELELLLNDYTIAGEDDLSEFYTSAGGNGAYDGSTQITTDAASSSALLSWLGGETFAEIAYAPHPVDALGLLDEISISTLFIDSLTPHLRWSADNLAAPIDPASVTSGNASGFALYREHVEPSQTASDVPEPSTLAIFALGMIGLASRRFKKQS